MPIKYQTKTFFELPYVLDQALDNMERLSKSTNTKNFANSSSFLALKRNFQHKIVIPVLIPVTRRVKGYTRFVEKYVTGRRKRFRPHKVYIFLIRISSRVDLAMSVCPSVCLSGWTLRSRKQQELGYWYLACRFLSF